jgi:hypothetical protein
VDVELPGPVTLDRFSDVLDETCQLGLVVRRDERLRDSTRLFRAAASPRLHAGEPTPPLNDRGELPSDI